MRLNKPANSSATLTREGGHAALLTHAQALRRSVMSCFLWEDEFYEDGEAIADRILRLAASQPPAELAALAIEAREKAHLRHVPLLLLSVLARTGKGDRLVADTIARVITRADDLCELLAVHARVNGVPPSGLKKTISAQMKKGLARALTRFDAYQLAKYDRDGDVRLRDVLFLVHAKPKDEAQAEIWKQLVEGTLPSPDTWEVQLSGGADKKGTFERLIREDMLGYLALLRNLRNMAEAGCDRDLVRDAILARRNGAQRVLPFRYVAAARAAPQFEHELDTALCAALGEMERIAGNTVILVDVSGSMGARLSRKSDLTRMDAAAVLASMWPGKARIFTFSQETVEVPQRPGMAGVDAIRNSQPHGGTYLAAALDKVSRHVSDRLVVITDEQAHDTNGALPGLARRNYLVNVASNRNGVGYGESWTHIDGFSEQILRFIGEAEKE